MKTKLISMAALIFGVVLTLNYANAQGTINVEFKGLESNKGKVIFMLFNKDDGFPGKIDKAFKMQKVEIKNGSSTVIFENVPIGEYAVSAIHDENDNGELEKNWMGMPKENVGMSGGNPSGKPSYNKAKFTLSEAEASMQISFEPFKPFNKK